MKRSELAAVAVGAALGAAVVVLWKRSGARPLAPVSPLPSDDRPAAPVPVDHPVRESLMASELERLAGVAVSHGANDPAVDVFLAFVGALDPPPDALTLGPAARRIGQLRLEQARDAPGESRLGASRLLAAAGRPDFHEPARSEAGTGQPGAVTVERPVETGRRLPELVEALLHAVRAGLGLFAAR